VNLLGILGAIKSFFGNGGAGNTLGNTVANGVSGVALLAALAPAVMWFLGHKDEIFVTFQFSYGQAAVVCGLLFFLLKLIHYTRPGSPQDRGQG
jgi:hypothetical protein